MFFVYRHTIKTLTNRLPHYLLFLKCKFFLCTTKHCHHLRSDENLIFLIQRKRKIEVKKLCNLPLTLYYDNPHTYTHKKNQVSNKNILSFSNGFLLGSQICHTPKKKSRKLVKVYDLLQKSLTKKGRNELLGVIRFEFYFFLCFPPFQQHVYDSYNTQHILLWGVDTVLIRWSATIVKTAEKETRTTIKRKWFLL